MNPTTTNIKNAKNLVQILFRSILNYLQLKLIKMMGPQNTIAIGKKIGTKMIKSRSNKALSPKILHFPQLS